MTVRRALKHLFVFTMAAALGGILAGGNSGLPAQNPSSKGKAAQVESINNEDCALCHDGLAKACEKNPHAVLEKSSKFNIKNSCERRPGPGQAHVSNEGDKEQL